MLTLPETLPKLIGYNYDRKSEKYGKYYKLINSTSFIDFKGLRALVDQMETEDLDTSTRNAESMKVIVDTRDGLIAWFKSTSFPTRIWSHIDLKEEKRTRDRKQVDAHWLVGIKEAFNELVPHGQFTVDEKYIRLKYDEMRKEIVRLEERYQSHRRELEQMHNQEKEEKKKLFLVFELATKYNLLPADEVSPYDIESHILSQDKYLNLAWSMEQTRGDWSEGFWRVEDALKNFEITTPLDSVIYNELSEIMSSDEMDGRVFRDTTHDYDFIYQLVENKELEVDLRRISVYSEY